MVASVNWGFLFAGVLVIREPYYFGSIRGTIDFLNAISVIMSRPIGARRCDH